MEAKIARLTAPLTALLVLLCGAATAAEIEDLYQGQTVVTGEREETRAPGFAECLEPSRSAWKTCWSRSPATRG